MSATAGTADLISSSLPQSKRARTESDTALKEDTEFWYEDGNIVLVAQDTAFRVYKGMLAKRSPVFKDLFTIPQPAEQEQVSGCPSVHLSDSVWDLRMLLRALYGGRKLSSGPENAATIPELAAIIRLAQKYGIDDLRDDGLHYLAPLCPADFTSMDLLLRDTAKLSGICPIPLYRREALTILNLARITETDRMLPMAMYLCCQLESATLLHGYMLPDGTTEKLAAGDLLRCMDGQIRLAQQMGQRGHYHVPIAGCLHKGRDLYYSTTSSPSCQEKLNQYLAALKRQIGNKIVPGLTCAGLSPFDKIFASIDNASLCAACTRALRETVDKSRRECWNALPSLFDLPLDGWNIEPEPL